MARLAGVPHFRTEASWNEEKDDLALLRRAKKMDDNGVSLRKAQIESVLRMKNQFKGYILRRTTDSLTWDNQTILNLPPHKDILGVLTLTAREKAIIEERARAAKERYVSIKCHKTAAHNSSHSVMSANESGKFLTTVCSSFSLTQ